MLRGKATLPLWFELSHDYVGPAVTEIIYSLVGLIRAGFSAVGLFLGRKSKISQEQNVNLTYRLLISQQLCPFNRDKISSFFDSSAQISWLLLRQHLL